MHILNKFFFKCDMDIHVHSVIKGCRQRGFLSLAKTTNHKNHICYIFVMSVCPIHLSFPGSAFKLPRYVQIFPSTFHLILTFSHPSWRYLPYGLPIFLQIRCFTGTASALLGSWPASMRTNAPAHIIQLLTVKLGCIPISSLRSITLELKHQY